MRSITLYSMNIGSMVLWSFWGLLFYSGADTPYWFKGCIALLCSCFVMFCYMGIMWKVSLPSLAAGSHTLTPTPSSTGTPPRSTRTACPELSSPRVSWRSPLSLLRSRSRMSPRRRSTRLPIRRGRVSCRTGLKAKAFCLCTNWRGRFHGVEGVKRQGPEVEPRLNLRGERWNESLV
jgi:hypothetical protein